jgi:NADPH-dependent curcumin reductase CurA
MSSMSLRDRADINRKIVLRWIQTVRLKYLEDIREELENAPSALIGLLRGENFGKLIIKLTS